MLGKLQDKYISELIDIEQQARRLIVQALEHNRNMQLEEVYGDEEGLEAETDYTEERKKMVSCIAKLNAAANFMRKGRDDLTVGVLEAANAALRACAVAGEDSDASEARSAAHVLALDVVESFAAVRDYFSEIEGRRCLERVDPQLCNNAGLVARLVDWEESLSRGGAKRCGRVHDERLGALEYGTTATLSRRLEPMQRHHREMSKWPSSTEI